MAFDPDTDFDPRTGSIQELLERFGLALERDMSVDDLERVEVVEIAGKGTYLVRVWLRPPPVLEEGTDYAHATD